MRIGRVILAIARTEANGKLPVSDGFIWTAYFDSNAGTAAIGCLNSSFLLFYWGRLRRGMPGNGVYVKGNSTRYEQLTIYEYEYL